MLTEPKPTLPLLTALGFQCNQSYLTFSLERQRIMKIGTEVTTVMKRKTITAVVAGTHWKKRGGRAREVARIVTGDETALDHGQVVCVSMDEVLWFRCTEGMLKPTGNSVSKGEAYVRLDEVKTLVKQSKNRRINSALEAADSAEGGSLLDCRIGDSIQINYSDVGWQTAQFAGFVKSSGNVRYTRNGRKRTTHPSNARVAGD